MDHKCHVCHKEAGGAHKCKKCQKVVHLICGAAEDEEEGYGQDVTCNVCRQHTTDGIELVYIRHTLYITRKWKIIFSCLYNL